MRYRYLSRIFVPTVFLLGAGIVQADDLYIVGAWGISDLDDVTNDGNLTNSFTTGTVTGVSPPLTLPSGTPVEWDTEFDDGDLWSLSIGWQFQENFRAELEYDRTEWDVDKHTGVTAGGINLTDVDAGVLISGNVGDLGVSTGNLVANGKGSIESDTLFLNGYYDFTNDSPVTPYLGLGVGASSLDVDYSPSGVSIIDDDDTIFVYQASAGILFELTEDLDIQAAVNWVGGEDATVDSTLLPAEFDIDPESLNYRIGLKFNF